MPKGHPLPFRLLSACFGKPGASATVARSLSPRSAKGGTAASPLYGIFSAFLGLGSDTRGLTSDQYFKNESAISMSTSTSTSTTTSSVRTARSALLVASS